MGRRVRPAVKKPISESEHARERMAAQEGENNVQQESNVQEGESNVVVASGRDQIEEKDQEEEAEEVEKEKEAAEEKELAEGMFLVEEVRAKRMVKGSPQYLIKWQNWDESYCTWEPVSHLETCIDFVKDFEDRLKLKKRKRKRGGGRTPARKKKAMEPTATQSESGHESGIDEGATPVEGDASDGLKSPETSIDANVATPSVKEKEPNVADDTHPSKASTDEALDVEETKSPAVVVMLDGTQENQVKESVMEVDSPVSEPVVSAIEIKDQDKEKEVCREEEKRPTPVAVNEPDAGSSRPRKRKPAIVRRVSQGPETQPHVLEETVSRGIGLKSPQAAGSTLQDYSVSYPGPNITRKAFSSPERVIQRPSTSSQVPFVKILKPISYSNSTKNDRQEVTVLFSVLRSDEKEVVVDNKYLRQQYPQLLIDFYEQHLRYTSK